MSIAFHRSTGMMVNKSVLAASVLAFFAELLDGRSDNFDDDDEGKDRSTGMGGSLSAILGEILASWSKLSDSLKSLYSTRKVCNLVVNCEISDRRSFAPFFLSFLSSSVSAGWIWYFLLSKILTKVQVNDLVNEE